MIKALRKTEISEFFIFASFGIVRLPKFGIFFSKFAKILRKKFRNKFGSKTGVSKHSEFTEYSEFVLFQIFQKLQKNDVKIKFLFSWKLVLTQIFKFGMQGLSYDW